MELREIQTFLSVADLQSFSRAAKQLGYSQSAVTMQIQNLERELNTKLFDRIGRHVAMTYAGHVFYEHGCSVMKEVDKLRETLSDAPELTGTLSIGAIESIGSSILPELLERYHSLHPGVSVSVHLDSPDALLDRLGQNTLDIVYLLDQSIYEPAWVKAMEEPEDIVFVAAAGHPLLKEEELRLEDILREPFVLTEKNASYRFTLDRYLASKGLSIQPFLEIGNTDFIIRRVRKGDCISFLPAYALQDGFQECPLRTLPVKDFHMSLWRQLLYHKNKWVTREMKEFFSLFSASSA